MRTPAARRCAVGSKSPIATSILCAAILAIAVPASAQPAPKPVEAAPTKSDRPPQPETPARTPLPRAPDSARVPWKRLIEVGGDFVFAQRIAASEDGDGNPTSIRYKPVPGFGLHFRWEIFKYLRAGIYFIDADHEIDLPPGALGLPPTDTPEIEEVHTFSFGARLAPTLPITDRARVWVSAGIGWGRLEFARMEITNGATGNKYEVRERADPFVEFPLGIGGSFDIIPRWLSIDLEVTGAFVADEESEALGDAQTVDDLGKKRNVGGFPGVDGTFVQTIGLSLIL